MKRRNKIIALLAAMALCLGLFAGCSSKTDDDADTANTADSTTQNTVTDDANASDTDPGTENNTEDTEETIENFVVEVVSTDGTSLELKQYNAISADTVIEDYIDVDFSLFEATEATFNYSIYEAVSIVLVENGAATETTADEITPGDMLVFFVTEDGQGIIAIHHPQDGDTVDTSNTTEPAS